MQDIACFYTNCILFAKNGQKMTKKCFFSAEGGGGPPA